MPKTTRCGGFLGFVNKGEKKARKLTGLKAGRLKDEQANRLTDEKPKENNSNNVQTQNFASQFRNGKAFESV